MEKRAAARRINAHRIVLKVNESVILNKCEQVKAALARLNQIGFQIFLDDFGKLFPLFHLKDLMIQMPKTDKAFPESACENTRTQELIRSILPVLERRGINIVVEGVETDTQPKLPAGLNAYAAQGCLLSRSLSNAASTAFGDKQCGGN